MTLSLTRSVCALVYSCRSAVSETWGSCEMLRKESPLAIEKTGNNFPLLIFLGYLEKPWESNFELIIPCSLFPPYLVLMFLMNSLTFFIGLGPGSWKAVISHAYPRATKLESLVIYEISDSGKQRLRRN